MKLALLVVAEQHLKRCAEPGRRRDEACDRIKRGMSSFQTIVVVAKLAFSATISAILFISSAIVLAGGRVSLGDVVQAAL